MQFTKMKAAAVIGAGAIAVAGSGVAFAVWTDVSNPSAITGTVSNNGDTLTLSTGDSSGPGTVALPTTLGGSTNVYVYASNVTRASQVLNHLSAALSAPGCSVGPAATSDFTIDSSHIAIAAVAAQTNNVSQGYFTVTLNSLTTNQDACQGASESFTVTGS